MWGIEILNEFESEVSNFGRATEAERKPAAVADVDVTEAVSDFHDAARVLEDGKERHAENSDLRAVRVSRQSQRKISLRAVVDEFGVMRQQNFNRVVGNIFKKLRHLPKDFFIWSLR